MRKITREEERKLLRKLTWSQQEQEKRSWTINKLKVHQQSKNQDIQTRMSKERTMFSL